MSFKLKKKNMNFRSEEEIIPSDVDVVIGVDEAGRGALAGPVGVGAVARILCEVVRGSHSDPRTEEDVEDPFVVRDSKKMTRRARTNSYEGIRETYVHAIELVPNEVVDELNVLQATLQGMRTAVLKCVEGVRTAFDLPDDIRFFVLVDGNQRIPDLPIEQKCVTHGDDACYTIAMASILAKESRDVFVENEMHVQFPAYDFPKHKGYGTALHFQKIQEHGPCSFHRTSFRLVKNSGENPEERWAR
jgi:ribonuclease HII